MFTIEDQLRLSRRDRRIIAFLLVLQVISFVVIGSLFYSRLSCSADSSALLPQMATLRQPEPACDNNLVESTRNCTRPAPIRYQPKSDHFLFAVWWPPALALGRKEYRDKAKLHRKWLIHGLWPQADFELEPQQRPFAFDEMPQSLAKQLSVLMPNLAEYQEDYFFWQRQYNDHGRYSPFNTTQYFQKCTNLYRKLALPDWQRTAGIRPNDHQPYLWEDFVADLPSVIPSSSVNLVCMWKDGEQYLREIQICLTGRLTPTGVEHCYATDNLCDHCRPFYYQTTTHY